VAARLALFEVVFVVALITRDEAAGDFDGDGGERFEQVAIVGNQQQGALKTAQVAAQPFDRGQVEIVGGFVEQQDVGFGDQHGRGKTEPAERAFSPRTHFVAAEVLEADLHVAKLLQLLGIGRVERVHLLLQFLEFGHGILGILDQGLVDVLRIQLLAQVAEPNALRHQQIALVGLLLPGDHAEDGRLAGAVRSDDSDPFLGHDFQVRVLEDVLHAVVCRV